MNIAYTYAYLTILLSERVEEESFHVGQFCSVSSTPIPKKWLIYVEKKIVPPKQNGLAYLTIRLSLVSERVEEEEDEYEAENFEWPLSFEEAQETII
jgi:hypothetical protein